MGDPSEMTILEVLLFGMLGMFLMALSIVFFFVVYQKRLLKQQKEYQKEEARYQKGLLQASIESQEKERNRVARDLHDDIGAMLNTIKLYTSQIDSSLPENELGQLKNKTNYLIDDTIQNVRRISHDLHSVILKNFGLAEAIENLIEKVADSGEIKIELTYKGYQRLKYDQELALYRIAQELISNAIKHAKATTIDLNILMSGQSLKFSYVDDGIGFDPPKDSKFSGLGLKNIESRLNLYGGKVEYLEVAKGTSINIEMNTNERAN